MTELSINDRRFSVAPMMECTDRHGRYFLRQCSRRVLLYSEMITAAAVDPQQNTTWLAGASPGGLWRSTDAGSSWHQSGAFQHIHTLLKPREIA